MVLDDSTLQVMVDSVRALDDKLLVVGTKGLPPPPLPKVTLNGIVARFFLFFFFFFVIVKVNSINVPVL